MKKSLPPTGLLDTPAQALRYLKAARRAEDVVLDFEGQGLEVWHGHRIIGVALHVRGLGGAYLPFRHEAGRNLPITFIRELDFIPLTKTVIGHHLQYDVELGLADGLPIPERIEDTQLGAHLRNENEYDFGPDGEPRQGADGKMVTNFKLKELGRRYVSPDAGEAEDRLMDLLHQRFGLGADKDSMRKLTPAEVAPYAIQDAALTRSLRDFLVDQLTGWQLLSLWREVNEYQLAMIRIEARGVLVDQDRIRKFMAETAPTRERVFQEMQDLIEPTRTGLGFMTRVPVNPRSPQKVKQYLRTPATDRETLKDFIDALPADNARRQFMEKLLDWRGLDKVNSSFYEPYLRFCDRNSIIHTSFDLTGTVAGRASCREPNLQAVPTRSEVYKVKDVFRPRPGKFLLSADYSLAEVRWISHYANERSMLELLLRGDDIHQATADKVTAMGVPMNRTQGKRTNFSSIYGIGVESLAERLRVPESQARLFLNAFHRAYPGFRRLYNKANDTASERGYIRLFTGRVRRYDEHNPPHKASSNLIQGAVAEMLRLAITRLDRAFRNSDVDMVLQVHDQVIFEIPHARRREATAEVVRIMEDFKLRVPMLVDLKASDDSWGQMKKMEKAA